MFKFIRIRRNEKAREREVKEIEAREKKIAEVKEIEAREKKIAEEKEQKEKEHQQFLEITKKGEFLLNYGPEVYINKIGKKLDDYDFENIETINSDYKKLSTVVLDAKVIMIKKAKKLEAEVVTDIRHSIGYSSNNYCIVYMTGTALIPKKKK